MGVEQVFLLGKHQFNGIESSLEKLQFAISIGNFGDEFVGEPEEV